MSTSKGGRPGGEALVRTYAKLDPSKTKMKQFPMVQEIHSAWEAEIAVPYQEEDDAFWQTAVRWSLLRKFSHCPKELENPYHTTEDGHRILQFSNQDMKNINTIWEEQCALAASTSAISIDAEDKDVREFMRTSGLSNGCPFHPVVDYALWTCQAVSVACPSQH